MSRNFAITRTLAIVAGLAGPVAAQTPQPPPTQGSTARLIGTHQIDRYAAIEQVRKALEADPKNLADWILLGELAQEVGEDAPADRAEGYFRLARESYEDALKLDPNNEGLKAAAKFAADQERGAEKKQAARLHATTSYLSSRRRELTESGYSPTIRVYPSSTGAATATPGASPYAFPRYQPYVGRGGNPYTYQQHDDSFFNPVEPRFPGQEITATERAALVKPGARMAPP